MAVRFTSFGVCTAGLRQVVKSDSPSHDDQAREIFFAILTRYCAVPTDRERAALMIIKKRAFAITCAGKPSFHQVKNTCGCSSSDVCRRKMLLEGKDKWGRACAHQTCAVACEGFTRLPVRRALESWHLPRPVRHVWWLRTVVP